MRKWIPTVLGLAIVVFVLWSILTYDSYNLMRRLDNVAYDLQLQTRILTHRNALKNDWVAIVDIDDTSLKIEGHWPWPRNVLANLVNKLQEQGAVVIAFDILFSEPQYNIATEVMEELQQQKLLTPALASLLEKSQPYFDRDATFAQALTNATAILGVTFI